jgi:hypothetical protein
MAITGATVRAGTPPFFCHRTTPPSPSLHGVPPLAPCCPTSPSYSPRAHDEHHAAVEPPRSRRRPRRPGYPGRSDHAGARPRCAVVWGQPGRPNHWTRSAEVAHSSLAPCRAKAPASPRSAWPWAGRQPSAVRGFSPFLFIFELI